MTEKINIQHWTDEKWCPLFGAFPVSNIPDRVSEKCLAIIEDARSILGGFEYLPGELSPDTARIENNTGYPAAWILGARILVHEFDADEILFDAQFRQGNYRNGNGWETDRNGPYLLIDADLLDPAMLNESIRIKAGLPHEFIIAFTDDTNKLPEKDDSAVITPAMTFALMAISVSWDLFQNIEDGTVQTKSTEVMQQLLTAEKLLKRMHQLIADGKEESLAYTELEKDLLGAEKKDLQDNLKEAEEKKKTTDKMRFASSIRRKLNEREINKSAVKRIFDALPKETPYKTITRNALYTAISEKWQSEKNQINDKVRTAARDSHVPTDTLINIIRDISKNTIQSICEELSAEGKIKLPEKVKKVSKT